MQRKKFLEYAKNKNTIRFRKTDEKEANNCIYETFCRDSTTGRVLDRLYEDWEDLTNQGKPSKITV